MYTKSFNESMLIGKCGNELTLRFTQKGVPVTNLILGTQTMWKDNNSSDINKSMEWHKVVVWGRLAEKVVKFAKKGSILLVKGPISYREHINADGQKIIFTEIKAIKIQKICDSYPIHKKNKDEDYYTEINDIDNDK